ncbi:MAG: NAD kinase [Flavobacteriales bacterium]|jgi:NAD+ kinase|nr:NAD kinase [Flavobacteriales bacterium]MBK6755972.1 NAD kinase [Flavobacteriales bacterium]MBK7752035.1 NAD kinase [Flavobacteriales bacterium]MBK9073985.1 NAD kinase [Flavobacteriales bacterium]
MRIGILARRPEPEMLPLIADLLDRMPRSGLVPVLDHSVAGQLATQGLGREVATFPTDQVPADLDLVISLGGDGTFLRSVGLVARQGIPVLGVNLGRLGFLAAIRTEELDEALEHLSKRQFTLEERILLSLEGCDAEFEGNTLALNDVSFHKRDTSSMITVNTYVDGRFLNTYWADGLIIATPTGSTAYSLSCGGPILDPACQGLVITPVAPHNLNVRPFVVPDSSVVRIVVEAREDKYLVNLDARSTTLSDPRSLTVRRAELSARFVHLPEHDFFTTLRNKLNWGLDARSGPAR